MKPRYTISQAIQDAADALKTGNDCSATTIRCTINDLMDAADKSGCKVNFEYDQKRAIVRVRNLINRSR